MACGTSISIRFVFTYNLHNNLANRQDMHILDVSLNILFYQIIPQSFCNKDHTNFEKQCDLSSHFF